MSAKNSEAGSKYQPTVLLDCFNSGVAKLFKDRGYRVDVFGANKNIRDTVGEFGYEFSVFTGGGDIAPKLYKAPTCHPRTWGNKNRDDIGLAMLDRVMPWRGTIGICRGAQFLSAVEGKARLFQDVTKHNSSHQIHVCSTGESVLASSTHHQQVILSKNMELIAYSNVGGRHELSSTNEVVDVGDDYKEPEIWTFGDGFLCFQGHPENAGFDEYTSLFWSALEAYLPMTLAEPDDRTYVNKMTEALMMTKTPKGK